MMSKRSVVTQAGSPAIWKMRTSYAFAMMDFSATFDALKLPFARDGGTAFEAPLLFGLIDATSNEAVSDAGSCRGCCAGSTVAPTKTSAIPVYVAALKPMRDCRRQRRGRS